MRKILIGALILILGVLAYFFVFSSHHQEIEKTRTNITVGWIGTLSGHAKMLGTDNLNAVKLALAEYEAKKGPYDPDITLVSADDKYSNQTALDEYEKMMASAKPLAIIVATSTGLKTIAPFALRDSVILVNSIDNDKNIASLNHNVFLIAKETESLAGTLANAIIDQNKKNIAILYYGNGNDFMWGLANFSNEILKNYGLKTQLYEYSKGTQNFDSFLKKAHADHADAYLFLGYEEIGFAMKQARDMGIKAPFYSVNIVPDPILIENSQNAVNGTYFAHFTSLDGNRVKADEFMNEYQEVFHKKPLLEWTAMQGYDAANILIYAIKDAFIQKGDFTENLRNEILSTSNFEGVSGNITILPTGASRGIYPRLYIMENGKAVPANKL